MGGRQVVKLGLTGDFGGREGLKVEEFKIKGFRDWVVRGS